MKSHLYKFALPALLLAGLNSAAPAQTLLYQWNFDNATGSGSTLTVAPSFIDGSMIGGTMTNTFASASISSPSGSGVTGAASNLGLVQTANFGTASAGSLQAQVGGLNAITAFTVGIWFNYNASVTSFSALGSAPRLFDIQTATGSDGNELYLALNTGTNLQVGVSGGTRKNTTISPFGAYAASPATMTNNWFFVGLSYTTAAGGTANLYVGTTTTAATLQATLTGIGDMSVTPWLSTTNFISIGNNAGFGSRDLPGTIDDVNLYSGAGDLAFVQGIQATTVAVPEPSSAVLIGLGGLATLTLFRRRWN